VFHPARVPLIALRGLDAPGRFLDRLHLAGQQRHGGQFSAEQQDEGA
jgi:hypothetical protein